MKVWELKKILEQYPENADIDIFVNDSFNTPTEWGKIELHDWPWINEWDKRLWMVHTDSNWDITNINMTIRLNDEEVPYSDVVKRAKVIYRK